MESFVFGVLLLALYFLPTLLAPRGRWTSVLAVNLFLGWTLLGWVVALVMALRGRENAKVGT